MTRLIFSSIVLLCLLSVVVADKGLPEWMKESREKMNRIKKPDLVVRIYSCMGINQDLAERTKQPFKECNKLNSHNYTDESIDCMLKAIVKEAPDATISDAIIKTCITPYF